jgi:hypothetical protein
MYLIVFAFLFACSGEKPCHDSASYLTYMNPVSDCGKDQSLTVTYVKDSIVAECRCVSPDFVVK